MGAGNMEVFLIDLEEQLPRPTWAFLVKRKANFSCERCKKENDLVSHHKDRNKENNCLSNGECLCRNCHSKEHWTDKEGKMRLAKLQQTSKILNRENPGWQNIGWKNLTSEQRSDAVKKSWVTRRANKR